MAKNLDEEDFKELDNEFKEMEGRVQTTNQEHSSSFDEKKEGGLFRKKTASAGSVEDPDRKKGRRKKSRDSIGSSKSSSFGSGGSNSDIRDRGREKDRTQRPSTSQENGVRDRTEKHERKGSKSDENIQREDILDREQHSEHSTNDKVKHGSNNSKKKKSKKSTTEQQEKPSADDKERERGMEKGREMEKEREREWEKERERAMEAVTRKERAHTVGGLNKVDMRHMLGFRPNWARAQRSNSVHDSPASSEDSDKVSTPQQEPELGSRYGALSLSRLSEIFLYALRNNISCDILVVVVVRFKNRSRSHSMTEADQEKVEKKSRWKKSPKKRSPLGTSPRTSPEEPSPYSNEVDLKSVASQLSSSQPAPTKKSNLVSKLVLLAKKNPKHHHQQQQHHHPLTRKRSFSDDDSLVRISRDKLYENHPSGPNQ